MKATDYAAVDEIRLLEETGWNSDDIEVCCSEELHALSITIKQPLVLRERRKKDTEDGDGERDTWPKIKSIHMTSRSHSPCKRRG